MFSFTFYGILFTTLCALAVVVEVLPKGESAAVLQQSSQHAFKAFRNNYLFVYSMAMGERLLVFV